MSDFADLAAEREQQLRDDALAEQARRGKRHVEASAEHCAVCEEPIPAARRDAVPGVQTCIHCQRELEQAIKKGARK
jgi:phage/conjugal plasmid C-4 type zinc finger TraR family protein